jgi:two-component system phosphate regulon sensor histidine kinase PhoR
MGRNSIRLLIFLAAVSIIGITVTQIYWVKKAFDLKETQFNVNVNLGLKTVADSVAKINHSDSDTLNAVNQLSSNYFVVNISQAIAPATLERLLKKEFIKRGLLFNFGVVIYTDDKLIYGKCIAFNNASMDTLALHSLPDWKGNRIYFGIFFPGKDSNLAGQMSIWIFSSTILLVVIVFFSYTLFVILRQKKLSEIQRDFVNNMTHEFQTPISSILLSSQVLQDPDIVHTPQRLKQYATLINAEINKLSNQVKRILEMSTMESNLIRLDKELLDVHEIIREVRNKSLESHQLDSSDFQLHLQAGHPLINADRIHLENILHNLVENAIKYSPEHIEITVSTREERNGLLILVSDKGMGIDEQEKKKIFNKFYRIPQGNRHDVKGFGLGLNYVSLLVKAHNGIIDVNSTLGKGSEFILFFPKN